jgi:hypothetical protein
MKKIPRAKLSLAVCFFLLLPVLTLAGQEEKQELRIRIDQITADDFPNMTIYAVIENDKGEVVTNLSPSLFSFRIDSAEADIRSSIVPFSMKETPIDYSIIFSNNGIMEGEPLDFQKNAILKFVDAMKEGDSLSLYTIGEDAAVIFEDTAKEAVDPSMINGVEITSVQPRLYDSVINVMRKVQRKREDRRVVIIISDGRDQNSRFTKDQLNTVLSEVGVPVYAIGIRVLNTQSLSNLNEIADLTGGSYLYAATLQTIPDRLRDLTAKITQPYVITARVRKMMADNLPHVLEIAVNERDAAGRGQKTFTAVKVPVPRWVKWVVLGVIVICAVVTVVLMIIFRIRKRKAMGITRRRCPDCGNLMKDSWDSCPFCRYLPDIKKKKKTKAKKEK